MDYNQPDYNQMNYMQQQPPMGLQTSEQKQMGIVFPIIAGVKANNGELWEYPLTIKFLK